MARSGRSIPDAQRHTMRVRISRLSHSIARRLAGKKYTMAQVIETLLVRAAAEHADGETEAPKQDQTARPGSAAASRVATGSPSTQR